MKKVKIPLGLGRLRCNHITPVFVTTHVVRFTVQDSGLAVLRASYFLR